MNLIQKIMLIAVILLAATMRAEKPVNTTLFGIAIKGYDPVAYFTQQKPVKGNSEISYDWQGAEWRFTSEENRELFKKAPNNYSPQYGGYCAWAVSQGYTAGIDPEAWKIVEGKLYLNYSRDVQKKWEGDVSGNIAKADRNWPEIVKK